jgi:hypothetical protein
LQKWPYLHTICKAKNPHGKRTFAGKSIRGFQKSENALCSEHVIAYLRSDRTFSLFVDAATGTEEEKCGLGAILCKTDEKGEPFFNFICKQSIINK